MNPDTCALCPKLCRHVCPVAVGSGREAATPTAILAATTGAARGWGDPGIAARAVDLCTGCGACEAHCGVDQPVSELLRDARTSLQSAPTPEPLSPIDGEEEMVAILCTETDWRAPLTGRGQAPMAALRTLDHLGELALTHGHSREEHLDNIRNHFTGRGGITTCQGCFSVLEAAGIPVQGVWAILPPPDDLPEFAGCTGKAKGPGNILVDLACCGAGEPLGSRHPLIAKEVGTALARRFAGQPVYCHDTRCAAHLRSCGATALDPILWLTEKT